MFDHMSRQTSVQEMLWGKNMENYVLLTCNKLWNLYYVGYKKYYGSKVLSILQNISYS